MKNEPDEEEEGDSGSTFASASPASSSSSSPSDSPATSGSESDEEESEPPSLPPWSTLKNRRFIIFESGRGRNRAAPNRVEDRRSRGRMTASCREREREGKRVLGFERERKLPLPWMVMGLGPNSSFGPWAHKPVWGQSEIRSFPVSAPSAYLKRCLSSHVSEGLTIIFFYWENCRESLKLTVVVLIRFWTFIFTNWDVNFLYLYQFSPFNQFRPKLDDMNTNSPTRQTTDLTWIKF